MGELEPCAICGHVHDPEDGLCDAHAHVGIGTCPCPGEAILPRLRDAASAANLAMISHNRGGMSWLELDAAFARLDVAIRDANRATIDRGWRRLDAPNQDAETSGCGQAALGDDVADLRRGEVSQDLTRGDDVNVVEAGDVGLGDASGHGRIVTDAETPEQRTR